MSALITCLQSQNIWLHEGGFCVLIAISHALRRSWYTELPGWRNSESVTNAIHKDWSPYVSIVFPKAISNSNPYQ